MDTTFITIHDLTPEARILYASESIVDILGYSPTEVYSRSCWEFFHPDEVQAARGRHAQGVEMEKAAVLSYCRMRDRDGNWIGCEMVFTISYDVMVGCTSVYRRGLKSQNRAIEAPVIRRLFSNSPRDPRYHMLSHLSSKFTTPRKAGSREPRASLFLNRYTRTLTIMYATNGLADVLGISAEELRGRSFYYCIQENCLTDAVRCLENAKANDSIAYLRFWFRDPRLDDTMERREWPSETDEDAMEDVQGGEAGRAARDAIYDQIKDDSKRPLLGTPSGSEQSLSGDSSSTTTPHLAAQKLPDGESREYLGDGGSRNSHEAIFGEPEPRVSSASSWSTSPSHSPAMPLEIEAVISCTSDGLVVCMRQAATPVNDLKRYSETSAYSNGLFAVPWASEPVLPSIQQRLHYAQPSTLAPRNSYSFSRPSVTRSVQQSARPQQDFMAAIRDIAVFAWGITGINGSMADYGHGQPRGESLPAAGLRIWKPEAQQLAVEQDGTRQASHTVPAADGQVDGNMDAHDNARVYR